LAPEALNHNKAKLNGEKLDTFALGVTLMELLLDCVTSPFESASKHDKLYGLLIEDLASADTTSKFFSTLSNLMLKSECSFEPFTENPALIDLLKSMLHPMPEKRPTLTELLQDANWLLQSGSNNNALADCE
jgi:serine/threonine protein kinase